MMKETEPTSMMFKKQLPSGESLLTATAEAGIAESMKRLLRKATQSDINGVNRNGSSALHVAAAKGHHKIVQMLLERQASTELTDKLGLTALHLACLHGHLDIVETLLRNGYCPNGSGHPSVSSPMMMAMGISDDIILLLMRHGADMNRRQSWGNNVFSRAIASGNVSLVQGMMLLDIPDFTHQNISGYNVFHGIFHQMLSQSRDEKDCNCEMLKVLVEYVKRNRTHMQAVRKALTEVMPACVRSGCLTCFVTALPFIDIHHKYSNGIDILQHAMTPDYNWRLHGPQWTYVGHSGYGLNGHRKDMVKILLESGVSLLSVKCNVIGILPEGDHPGSQTIEEMFVIYIRAWGGWYSDHPESAQIFRKISIAGNMDNTASLICWSGYTPIEQDLKTIKNARKNSDNNPIDSLRKTFTENPRPLLNIAVLCVRHCLCDNVFYKSSLLNLPKALEDHLTLKPIVDCLFVNEISE